MQVSAVHMLRSHDDRRDAYIGKLVNYWRLPVEPNSMPSTSVIQELRDGTETTSFVLPPLLGCLWFLKRVREKP